RGIPGPIGRRPAPRATVRRLERFPIDSALPIRHRRTMMDASGIDDPRPKASPSAVRPDQQGVRRMNAAAPSTGERIARPAPEAPTEGRDLVVLGSFVDSWVEPAGSCDWDSRLVLQVAPRGRPRELLTVEA